MYPTDDQFMETSLKKVEACSGGGWSVTGEDGWSFFVPDDSPITPYVGQTVRLYGKGIGFPFRGMFLGGMKIFYSTEDEDKDYRQKELYGEDAGEWLSRWDSGRIVWSIEMGGMGPGYEQAIQVTVAELLRIMLSQSFDSSKWAEKSAWEDDRSQIRKLAFENDVINELGLSGAQFGAALSLASKLYMDGPIKVMSVDEIKDRHIQVSKNFP